MTIHNRRLQDKSSAKQAALTAQRLREVLDYDPLTGCFTWKIQPAVNMRIGQTAGSVNVNGYRVIKVGKFRYLAHRLAWLYVTGEWPHGCIDHKDHNRDHNSIANLREATKAQNGRNRRTRQKNNRSGVLGVYWCRRRKKWIAQIQVNGVVKKLGRFVELSDAAHARRTAEVKYFGEFASNMLQDHNDLRDG